MLLSQTLSGLGDEDEEEYDDCQGGHNTNDFTNECDFSGAPARGIHAQAGCDAPDNLEGDDADYGHHQ